MCHLHNDDVHVTIFDSTDFFATSILTEHTAFDGDALHCTLTTATSYGKSIFIETGECGVGGQQGCEFISHFISFN